MGDGHATTSTAERTSSPLVPDPFAASPPEVRRGNDARRPSWSGRERVLVAVAVAVGLYVMVAVVVLGSS
jgi:hypothetical protein